MRSWDTNIDLKDLERPKTEESMTKAMALVRSDLRLMVTVTGSVFNLYNQTVHDILTEVLGMWTVGCCITTTLPITLSLPWTSGSEAPHQPDQIPCEFILHPDIQIPTQSSLFWNCEQRPKWHNRPAEGFSTWRLAALLPGVGTTSLAVCDFPRKLLWRKWRWILFQLLKKMYKYIRISFLTHLVRYGM
jgi:hypothetical protein